MARTARKTLKPVRPGLGIEAEYRRQLVALIDAMHRSVRRWITAKYRANQPRIAQDATPSEELRRTMAGLGKRWQDAFDKAAEGLAGYFAKDVDRRSTAELHRILKKSGVTVKFTMTPAMRDVFDATINQNVALIKSIPKQYLADVEGLVQRSVQQGRDLEQLTNGLLDRYDITRKRAKLIARDQNNKATAAFTRARRTELGMFKAVWMHSSAGKELRPAHVAMNGKEFDIRKGMWDSHEKAWVQPGELINCRCLSRPVVEGFTF